MCKVLRLNEILNDTSLVADGKLQQLIDFDLIPE